MKIMRAAIGLVFLVMFTSEAALLGSLADDYVAGTNHRDTTAGVGLPASNGSWNYYQTSTVNPSSWSTLLLEWGKVAGATRSNYGYVSPFVNVDTGIGGSNGGISSQALFTGNTDPAEGFLYMHSASAVGLGIAAQWKAGAVDPLATELKIDLGYRKSDTAGATIDLYVYHNSTLVYSDQSFGSTTVTNSVINIASYSENDTISFVLNNDGSVANDGTWLSADIASVPEPASFGMLSLGAVFLLLIRRQYAI